MKDPDVVVGATMTAAGSAGLTAQWALDFGSLLVIVVNLCLGIGGMYLLALRIRKARRDLNDR